MKYVYAAVFVIVLATCSGEKDSSCIELNESCTSLYEPTFDNVFDNTLKPTCGGGGVFCHASGAGAGGLVFDTADKSFDLLLEKSLIVPGDASCSELTHRIEGANGLRQMPPGSPLDESERCAIETWIQNGASR